MLTHTLVPQFSPDKITGVLSRQEHAAAQGFQLTGAMEPFTKPTEVKVPCGKGTEVSDDFESQVAEQPGNRHHTLCVACGHI